MAVRMAAPLPRLRSWRKARMRESSPASSLQFLPRAVAGAVVDHDQLQFQIERHGQHAANDRRQRPALVVQRNQDRKLADGVCGRLAVINDGIHGMVLQIMILNQTNRLPTA